MRIMDRTFEQIEADYEKAEETYLKKFKEPNDGRSWDEFLRYTKKEIDDLDRLSREKRMMMSYELDDIPDFADVMPIKQFIECVDNGLFIDYDGSGNYVLNGKETNVPIYPSDVEHGAIRWEFDSVAWYNK